MNVLTVGVDFPFNDHSIFICKKECLMKNNAPKFMCIIFFIKSITVMPLFDQGCQSRVHLADARTLGHLWCRFCKIDVMLQNHLKVVISNHIW